MRGRRIFEIAQRDPPTLKHIGHFLPKLAVKYDNDALLHRSF